MLSVVLLNVVLLSVVAPEIISRFVHFFPLDSLYCSLDWVGAMTFSQATENQIIKVQEGVLNDQYAYSQNI